MEKIMKKFFFILTLPFILVPFAYGSGCSDMAAFNTQMNKSLAIASLSETAMSEIRDLMSECSESHQRGLPVASIDSCNKALKMVATN